MSSPSFVGLAEAVSSLIGWIYFLCWSISFYPQPILNWRRKSCRGVAIDFPTLNILGFVCYTASTAALLYSSTVRNQYAIRNPTSPEPTVKFNDFAYGVHAVVLSVFVYTQFWPVIWGFKVGADQRASKPALAIIWGSIAAIAMVCFLVWSSPHHGHDDDYTHDNRAWAWIDLVYALGYVKLLVTVVKYIPQAWSNYKRKSTVGWSIGQILLDVTGGILSLLQLIIDASLQADWSGITGNPVKFGLGNITLFFDTIFLVQHYWLYKDRTDWDKGIFEDVNSPLLSHTGNDHL